MKAASAIALSAMLLASSARADEKHQYGPKPFEYSLPFQLRPAITWNVLRSDTSLGFYQNGDNKGSALVTSLLFGYKVTEAIQPFVRVAYTHSSPPAPLEKAGAISNPIAGVTYGLKPSDDVRVAAILAVSLPLGQGGGDVPGAATGAQQAGNFTRSAMDGALFAVNDVGIIPGVSVAYIANKLTLQGELTYVQLMRTRGTGDRARAVITSGVHLGYFLIPQLSVGGELRYQRFLTTPLQVERIPAARDNLTFAIGLRGHFALGERFWLRPGVSFTMPIDAPLSDSKLKVVQLDIPFVF